MLIFHLREEEQDEKKSVRSYYAHVTQKGVMGNVGTLRIRHASGSGSRFCPRTWLIQAFWTRYRTQSEFKQRVDKQGPKGITLHCGLGKRLLTFAVQILTQSGRMAPLDLVIVLPAALMYVEPGRNSQEGIEAYYRKLGFEPNPKSLYWSTSMETLLSRL